LIFLTVTGRSGAPHRLPVRPAGVSGDTTGGRLAAQPGAEPAAGDVRWSHRLVGRSLAWGLPCL